MVGVGVDFITASMSTEVAAWFLERGRLVEAGVARPGFARSERREVMGGRAWRRWEPHQPSKLWGLGYESWEAEGDAARGFGFDLRDLCRAKPGLVVRPSRVDVAWDFEVPSWVTADHVAERVEPWAERRGFASGISGQGGVNTRYIGSPNSERRLRVYRRDLRDKGLAFMYGPRLRVELVLRDDLARAWWGVHVRDDREAWAAAAAHVEEMTGHRVQPEIGDVPALESASEAVDAGQMVFQFIEQNAATLDAIAAAGIDLFELVGLKRGTWSRMTAHRHRERVDLLTRVGADAIEGVVRAMILGKRFLPASS